MYYLFKREKLLLPNLFLNYESTHSISLLLSLSSNVKILSKKYLKFIFKSQLKFQ